jgi:hypothetical protein
VSTSPYLLKSRRIAGLIMLTLCASTFAWAAATGFAPQVRMGYTNGDQWEPALAADGYGHVYVLYPQYGAVPECRSCPLPTLVLITSDDNGVTWQAPRQIGPADSGQFDPQIVVDPADHRTIYAAWVQNHERDVVVAKSADFGQSWSLVMAARNQETDKPVLAVRGQDVYLAFNQDHKLTVAVSHDGGLTFVIQVASKGKLKWSLPGGGTVDAAGNVYFSWAGYPANNAAGVIELYVSKSADQGKSWINMAMDVSQSAPECSAFHCGWSYLGAQITMASDAAGTLYALWNSGPASKGPERIYFSSSTTAGATWSPRASVSIAAAGVEHAFPAIMAGAAGDVRIAWMDSRNAPLWNTYYRSSTNGGATWSTESKLSTYVAGYSYIQRTGFRFPFGDYFGIAIDNQGRTQAVWGEGYDFKSPGSIWYSSGK